MQSIILYFFEDGHSMPPGKKNSFIVKKTFDGEHKKFKMSEYKKLMI